MHLPKVRPLDDGEQPRLEGGRMTASPADRMRLLPAVHRIVTLARMRSGAEKLPLLSDAAREVIEALRGRLKNDPSLPLPSIEEIADLALLQARRRRRTGLVSVINATGVVIHTNLGRAPLAPEAAAAVAQVAQGYCDLEFDLETGTRGSRGSSLERALAELVGAEAAVVVNNNAAAVFLTLRALALGKEVKVSRGELIEIGGSFRLPEIFAASGAILSEVGTTNRTRSADYQGGTPGMLLKVHRSNFRMAGFVAEPGLGELVEVARRAGVPLVFDLGGGQLEAPLHPPQGWDEPSVKQAIAEGVDLVCFSGDKLFGGPQAGIVVGRRDLVTALHSDPLYRMVRLDKLGAAALLATVALHQEGRGLEIPSQSACFADSALLLRRARSLARSLRAGLGEPAPARIEVVQAEGRVGGGAAPEIVLPGFAVRMTLRDTSVSEFLTALRACSPPVIGRADAGAVWLDPRTVLPGQEPFLVAGVRDVLGRSPGASIK